MKIGDSESLVDVSGGAGGGLLQILRMDTIVRVLECHRLHPCNHVSLFCSSSMSFHQTEDVILSSPGQLHD